MRFKKIYFVFVLVLVFFIYVFVKQREVYKVASVTSVPKITNTYAEIFLKSKSDLIKSDLTYLIPNKKPIATFNYEGKYKIIVSNFKTDSNVKIDNLISVSTGYSYQAFGTGYAVLLHLNNFDFACNKETIFNKINHIKLSMVGNSISRSFSNNNILAYNLLLDNLSLNINDEDDTEILVTKKQNTMNAEMVFLKKDENLFFILMIPNDGKPIAKTNTLLKLISH